MPSKGERVKVHCRVRPLSEQERKEAGGALGITGSLDIDRDSNSITVETNLGPKPFRFDTVFSPTITQAEVFDSCGKELVSECIEGYNGTLMA